MTISAKLGPPEAAAPSPKRAALDENDGAFASMLGGAGAREETPAAHQRVGADHQAEPQIEEEIEPLDAADSLDDNDALERVEEAEVAEVVEGGEPLEAEPEPAEPDAMRMLTEPKRSFWERLASAPREPGSSGPARHAFDVKLLERHAGQLRSEAVVPGPRGSSISGNAPPVRPVLSAADAALPTTVRPGVGSAEGAEVAGAKAASVPELPAAPKIVSIEATDDARVARARPAPSPPMSVTLQLATIAHDVLARAAQAVAPEAAAADAPQLPTMLTIRPAPTQVAGQDAFIQIEHPVLGRIRLQLVLDARNLSVRAFASNVAAAKALRESEQSMREDVARHGVDLERLHVDLKPRGREKK